MAQKQISSALQKSGLSLKDRYEKKQEEELVVERRPVVTILTVLGILRTALCCILAAIGLLTMLHPGLRQVFVNLLHAFFMEAGFLGETKNVRSAHIIKKITERRKENGNQKEKDGETAGAGAGRQSVYDIFCRYMGLNPAKSVVLRP